MKKVNRKALKIVEEVKNECGKLFGKKLKDIYLYGSYARGDYDNESDIDILLTLDLTDRQIVKYRRLVSHVSSELSLKYDITVSITMDAVKTFYRYTEFIPFYQNVLNEGINYGFAI